MGRTSSYNTHGQKKKKKKKWDVPAVIMHTGKRRRRRRRRKSVMYQQEKKKIKHWINITRTAQHGTEKQQTKPTVPEAKSYCAHVSHFGSVVRHD